MRLKPITMTVAGSDSSAGAGIQADLKSAAAAGMFCATAITSVTAQNTQGVVAVYPMTASQVEAQMEAVLSDMNVCAIKTGMLPTKSIVLSVKKMVLKYNIRNLVIDPVMISTSGHTLVDAEVCQAIIEELFPIATVVTPNIPETEFIAGIKIGSVFDFDQAAAKIETSGVAALLLKAGHLDSEQLTDILYHYKENRTSRYSFERITTRNTHGTGCSLSSYIAAFLAKGNTLEQSVENAERMLHQAILSGKDLHWGAGNGPIKHLDYE